MNQREKADEKAPTMPFDIALLPVVQSYHYDIFHTNKHCWIVRMSRTISVIISMNKHQHS